MSDEVQVQDELTTLKARADQMGISYHPSIGAEKLRDKITAKLEGGEDRTEEPETSEENTAKAETERQRKIRLKKEATKLVRIRLTCMNPAKRELEGELFTVGNSTVGTHTKFVPFGAEEGWHVPQIMYNMLKAKKFQHFQTVTENGQKVRRGKNIPEYSIEVLPPLTEKEIAELKQRQAMAKGQ